MTGQYSPSRRAFLGTSAALVIAVRLPDLFPCHAAASGGELVPNAFVRISADSVVTCICKHIEMGQGTYTGIATILADELDADWSQIRVVSAPADVEKYANSRYKAQGTGGSSSMANSWEQLRLAGAEARARLIAAAAASWDVALSEISIEKGILSAAGKSGSFGEFVGPASVLTLTRQPIPKSAEARRLVGKHVPKVDTQSKTDGTAIYTIDVKLPDLLTCVVVRPERFNARVRTFQASEALAVRGVREIFAVPQGVAVLATGYWPARKAAGMVVVEWDESGCEDRDTVAIFDEFKATADRPGNVARNDGDAGKALQSAAQTIEAIYTFPFLAHAPLEPNDCVIHRLDNGDVELKFGSQMQTIDQKAAAGVLGLDVSQVKIDTMIAGGSFGRRATPAGDMALEAAEVMKAAKHQGPIKVVWSREDDIKGGRYRPVQVHKLRGGIDAEGNITAWDQVIVGQSFFAGTPFAAARIKDGVDVSMVEGASTQPYQIPNLQVSAHIKDVGVPALWWRSVGHTHTAYATEAFLDELISLAGADPLDVRRRLLSKHPRHLGVLNLAAEKASWGEPLPQNRARGLAVHESFNSFVAQVVEVSIGDEGLPKVERVVCAVDCGIAINPDIVKAQMEGGIGFALSGCLFGAIDLDKGVVRQSNFHDYRVLRIDEMPKVEVFIVDSRENPTGVGEPGVPPLGPAVANAWAALTGHRMRDLPFSRSAARA